MKGSLAGEKNGLSSRAAEVAYDIEHIMGAKDLFFRKENRSCADPIVVFVSIGFLTFELESTKLLLVC